MVADNCELGYRCRCRCRDNCRMTTVGLSQLARSQTWGLGQGTVRFELGFGEVANPTAIAPKHELGAVLGVILLGSPQLAGGKAKTFNRCQLVPWLLTTVS